MLVTLEGQLEVFEAPILEDRLETSVHEGYINFVIDLTKVAFIGSANLTVLIKLLRYVQKAGGTVKLVEPENKMVKRVLYVTKFDRVFGIYQTVDQALTSFSRV